jgi:hypothetical protein
MPTLTTEQLIKQSKTPPKPQTQLDWSGAPMKSGDYYGGRPEHCAPAAVKPEEPTPSRSGKRIISPEGRANLRAAMQRARQVMLHNREKRKANA